MLETLQQRLQGITVPDYTRKFKLFLVNIDHSEIFGAVQAHSLPFDLEAQGFEITHDITDCDFIPTSGTEPSAQIVELYKKSSGKPVLIFHITHIFEQSRSYYERIYHQWRQAGVDNVHLIITDFHAKQNHAFAHNYDFLWNRQKAYYTEFDKHVKDSALTGKKDVFRIWSRSATKSMYELPDIVKLDTNNTHIYKKFLSPNRIGEYCLGTRRGMYRSQLSEYLLNQEDTYTSDWLNNRVLECQDSRVWEGKADIDTFGGWWPVANSYYSKSVLSVYVETLVTHTNIRTITEKTFDPLIKGHFILPFGYCGMISDITQHYDFCLPDWIDYSYDSERDELKRFYLFTRELLRLRNTLTIKDLVKLRNRDDYMLHRNRQIFEERPYHSLYQVVSNIVSKKTNPKNKVE